MENCVVVDDHAGGDMENVKMYAWEESYVAAILESDATKLPTLIDLSRNAIRARLEELSLDHGGLPAEQEALRTAIRGLDLLAEERLPKAK